MAQIIIDKPPLGERDARALVDWVVESDDRIEHHYLEIKSALEISTKRDQAKLAKFILGAANRMPDTAARAFGGYAVMILGAAHNAMTGIPPIELLDIERAVKPFIGANGPHWDVIRVPVPGSDNEVLLLLVDPPQWGQAPFICLKGGGDRNELRDGGIYFRATGETREAKSDEIAQLLRRGSVAAATAKVDVNVIGTVFAVDYDALDQVRDEYIEQQKNRLLLALHLAKNPPAAGDTAANRGFSSFAAALSIPSASLGTTTKPESRSEDQYHSEIIRWVQRVRDDWPKAMELFLGSELAGTEIEVSNHDDTFFEDAEVRVHLAGAVFGVPFVKELEGEGSSSIGLPSPPRSWGPFTVDILGSLNAGVPAWLQGIDPGSLGGASRSSWRNSGSIDLEFELDELRPRRAVQSDDIDVVLLTTSSDVTKVEGTWDVTAKGHHAVYSGRVVVEAATAGGLPSRLRELLDV